MTEQKASHPRHPSPAAKATFGGQRAISAALILVWGWLIFYLAIFFLTPLSSAPQGAHALLRRGHFWIALLLGDDMFAGWTSGASWTAVGQRAVILTAAGAILLVALAAGWLALRVSRVSLWLTRVEQWVFAAGVGLNLVSLATLALGLCGVMQAAVFAGLGASVLFVAGGVLWRDRQAGAGALPAVEDAGEATASDKQALQLSNRWLWLALPFVVVIAASAMIPPIEFDVREYHLQAPKEFYQQGRIAFVPHNVYANMPLGAEMLALAGMVVTGDWFLGALVGKLLIACFAPLTALALYAFGRRFASPAAGIVAALAYLSIPWIVLVSTQGLNDGALACYLFLAFYAACLCGDAQHASGGSVRLAALAGFLAGSAVCVKYPAVVYGLLPLTAFFTFSAWQRRKTPGSAGWSAALQPLLGFVLLATLACGPWLGKNAMLTGNPTYPLLYSWFDGTTRTPELDAQWTRAHAPPNYELSDLLNRAAGITLTSDWLSPLLMPLALLALVNVRTRRLAQVTAGYFVFIFLAWWLLTHRIDRFWVPALPLAALLAGIGATWNGSPWWRGTLAALAAVGLTFNFIVIASGHLIDNRYLADLGTLRTDPAFVEPWHLWLNEHTGEVQRVLLVGDAQPFDLNVPTTYNTVFDANTLEQIARDRTPAEVRGELKRLGISHVYVSWREIDRYRSPGNYGITDFLQPAVLESLVTAGVLEPLPPLPDDTGRMYRVVSAKPE